ncbi:MAG: hypothetical protein GY906_14670, partial [bacterium]|nr:hypothetical protein [bacterium]
GLGLLGLRQLQRDRSEWRSMFAGEAVFWLGFVAVLLLRLPNPEILGTEKPMDLGILATLIRAESFPPPDMWLAHYPLHYYYFGSLLWAAPLRLSGLTLDVGYNIVVAAQGGVLLSVSWALGRRIAGGRHGCGAMAALLTAFSGTPDGIRQLIAGISIPQIDIWNSSRQVENTITEFPLFTLWLGDLHPHLLSLPVSIAAFLVAAVSGRKRPGVTAVVLLAMLLTSAWMANPWCLPVTTVVIALGLVGGDGRWRWPWGTEKYRWGLALAVTVGAFVLVAPFLAGFRAPFSGLGTVAAWTRPLELALFCGPLLLVPFGLAIVGVAQTAFAGRSQAWIWVLSFVVLLAAMSFRPTLVLLAFMLAFLLHRLVSDGHVENRLAVGLAAVGVFLLLVPEVVYVRDPYGETLHRMNTVFKAYFQGWVLLAVVWPALLRELVPKAITARVLVGFVICIAAVHPVALVSRAIDHGDNGLDGLAWMNADDRELVGALRKLPDGSVMIEAVGDAYSQFGRLSAASGVSAYLGWENHQRVWRGIEIHSELERRSELVAELYSCGDSGEVARLARQESVDVVAIGSLERQVYPTESLAAIEQAGDTIASFGDSMLVAIGTDVTKHDENTPAGYQ